VDELHRGRFTLLATDPLSDDPVGLALVRANDQAHLRFLLTLQYGGSLPSLVISGGPNLCPSTLAEAWPNARPQLGVCHVPQDVTEKVLDGVRRLRRQLERRGPVRGPANKEGLNEQERADLRQMFTCLPEWKTLWRSCPETYQRWSAEQGLQVARWRWARRRNNGAYRQVPERKAVLAWRTEEKLAKTQTSWRQRDKAARECSHNRDAPTKPRGPGTSSLPGRRLPGSLSGSDRLQAGASPRSAPSCLCM
jgi:hypothetical protein